MDFRRIDKNTVQCRVTEDEMEAYGFRIEDFFTDQDRAREFLEQIVERAEEEVGYEAEGGMVSMQLMRLPDNSLNITFSDRGPDTIQGMIQHLQQMASIVDDKETEEMLANLQKDKHQGDDVSMPLPETDASNQVSSLDKNQKEYNKHMQEREKERRQKEKQLLTAAKIFSFESMKQVEQFAQEYQCKKNISSKLYRDRQAGRYYLLVKKGKLKMEEYQQLCRRLLDYGTLCVAQNSMEQYCKEHYECMISKHALRSIQEYCQ